MAVLRLAGQLLEAPGIAEPYSSVNLSEKNLGTFLAMNDLFGTLRKTIGFSVKPSRSRSVALTKLDEASMWVNRAISKG